MSDSSQTQITMDEESPLNTVSGSGEAQKDNTCHQVITIAEHAAESCSKDTYHRKLAICSIICGISCIGIKSLINSVKAEKEPNDAAAAKYKQRAKKYGVISIATWVSILILTPLLMGLISYLITLRD